MHAVGIHSALAIKRQRKRRDNARKARERRYSIQSSESGDTHSPHGSTRRKLHPSHGHAAEHNLLETKVVTSIGMLHIGVVFLVFGVFLLGAGFFPDNLSTQSSSQSWHLMGKGSWWNELVCTGLFAVGLGIFLIILNCVISNREEQDLETYVQRQLTRSRSGHRLERDVETGGLTTRHHRKAMQIQKGAAERGLDDLSNSNILLTPTSSEVVTPTTPSGGVAAAAAAAKARAKPERNGDLSLNFGLNEFAFIDETELAPAAENCAQIIGRKFHPHHHESNDADADGDDLMRESYHQSRLAHSDYARLIER